jgi:hypothetical protein
MESNTETSASAVNSEPVVVSEPPTPPTLYECAVCDVKTTEDLRCSRCRDITYCSVKCQHEDWPVHKKDCMTQEQRAAVFEMNREHKYRILTQKIVGNICTVAAHYGSYSEFSASQDDTQETPRSVKLLYGAVHVKILESTMTLVTRPITHYAHLNWIPYDGLASDEKEMANNLFAETIAKSSRPEEVVLVIYETRDRKDFTNVSLDPKDKLTLRMIKAMVQKPGEDWTVVVNL